MFPGGSQFRMEDIGSPATVPRFGLPSGASARPVQRPSPLGARGSGVSPHFRSKKMFLPVALSGMPWAISTLPLP